MQKVKGVKQLIRRSAEIDNNHACGWCVSFLVLTTGPVVILHLVKVSWDRSTEQLCRTLVLAISTNQKHLHTLQETSVNFLPKNDKISNFCSHFSIAVYEKIYFES